jgi:hypothetical protein
MQTTRQIERHWSARQYDRLARELLAARPENSPRLVAELSRSVPAAALAVIRLDELNQANHPLSGKLIRTIIAAQEGDGGWGDPLVSALCLRALMCNRGLGPVVDRGIAYLANLQKDEGAWPAIPIRRMTEDAFVTAFILFHLAEHETFRAAVRFDDALAWLTRHTDAVNDEATRRLSHRAALRARLRPTLSFAAAAN